jgi:hypothetical protein
MTPRSVGESHGARQPGAHAAGATPWCRRRELGLGSARTARAETSGNLPPRIGLGRGGRDTPRGERDHLMAARRFLGRRHGERKMVCHATT